MNDADAAVRDGVAARPRTNEMPPCSLRAPAAPVRGRWARRASGGGSELSVLLLFLRKKAAAP